MRQPHGRDISVENAGSAVDGTAIGRDPELDVAAVRLSHGVDGFNFALAVDTPRPGIDVMAVGFPLEQPKGLTEGTVSGVDRSIEVEGGLSLSHLLQTDVALNPGNSGGPLVNRQGTVVGIISAGRTDAEGINFAATASVAKPLIEGWINNPESVDQPICSPTPPPTNPTPSSPAISDAPATTPQRTENCLDRDEVVEALAEDGEPGIPADAIARIEQDCSAGQAIARIPHFGGVELQRVDGIWHVVGWL